MNVTPSLTHKSKAGTCPHGLPLGACPICNGMGGGGGGGASIKKADKPANEMSWSECYVAWQQMQKDKINSNQSRNLAIQAQMISQYKMQLSLGSISQKFSNVAAKLAEFVKSNAQNTSFASKILTFGARIILPGFNITKNVLNAAVKLQNRVSEKLADISDKLNAVFGELKNAIEKKISDRLKDFKKKIKSFFGIEDTQDAENLDDEEKRIEESKRLFELKTVLNTIRENFNKKEEKEFEDAISS